MNRMPSRSWVAAAALALTATVIGGAALASSHGLRQGTDTRPGHAPTRAAPNTPSDNSVRILRAIDSPRVDSLDAVGSTAEVTGEASTDPGDATRTLWYETVAGAALARVDGLDKVDRRVLDSSGSILDRETDPVPASADPLDPFAPPSLSSTDIESQVNEQAQSLGVKVVDVHYVGLFGGTAEIVVKPDDVTKFVGSAGSNVHTLLGPVGENGRPYLTTIVDASGAPQLILGFTPGVGGTNGQGMAWAAPGVQTDAIVGRPYVEEVTGSP